MFSSINLFSQSQKIKFIDQDQFDQGIDRILNDANDIEELDLEKLGTFKIEISILCNFSRLKRLAFNLSSKSMTDWHSTFDEQTIALLPYFRDLEKISLRACIRPEFSVKFLDVLSECANLRAIDLSDNYEFHLANGFDLGILQKLPNLTDLNISECIYQSSASNKLKGLEKIASLKNLVLARSWAGNLLNNEFIEEPFVLSLEQLERIDFSYCWYRGVRDPGYLVPFRQFFTKELPNLKQIVLDSTHIKDLDWAEFVPNLESLKLANVVFAEMDLRALGNFASLKNLGMELATFSKDNLWELQNMEPLLALEDLNLSYYSKVKGVDFSFAPNLKVLNLATSDAANGILTSISHLSQLESLDLSRTHITGTGLKKIAKLKNLKKLNLAALQLREVDFSTFVNLEILNLSSCEIDLDVFESLKKLTNLKVLNLCNISSKHITSQHLIDLRNALPNCEISQ